MSLKSMSYEGWKLYFIVLIEIEIEILFIESHLV
jgi:hypothetical protein